jgi:hypothetical protein
MEMYWDILDMQKDWQSMDIYLKNLNMLKDS